MSIDLGFAGKESIHSPLSAEIIVAFQPFRLFSLLPT